MSGHADDPIWQKVLALLEEFHLDPERVAGFEADHRGIRFKVYMPDPASDRAKLVYEGVKELRTIDERLDVVSPLMIAELCYDWYDFIKARALSDAEQIAQHQIDGFVDIATVLEPGNRLEDLPAGKYYAAETVTLTTNEGAKITLNPPDTLTATGRPT